MSITQDEEKAAEIERVQAEVERMERRGQFDTAHHEVLRNLTGGRPAAKKGKASTTTDKGAE